jgi:hypothetical protein
VAAILGHLLHRGLPGEGVLVSFLLERCCLLGGLRLQPPQGVSQLGDLLGCSLGTLASLGLARHLFPGSLG